jgi:hypothetical protein
MKDIGGADSNRWNCHLINRLLAALPGGMDREERTALANVAVGGQLAMKPADPVEAMLSAQMIAASNASMDCYRRAWIPEQTFEARMRFLALADKAARTVAVLAEALDRHRGRGQQQITVKHVTVNADQAVVADQVVTATRSPGGGGDDHRKTNQPHALAHSPVTPLLGEVEADRAAVPRAGR